MKKLIVVLIFACLVSLASLPVVSTSANSEKRRVTKALWYTPINGTAVTSETIDDVNNDGHEDILVSSAEEGGGYLTIISGKDGSTIRKTSVDYEPTEVLVVQESDRIAVAHIGGTDVYDMQLNHKFNIPIYYSWAYMYHYTYYWIGYWNMKHADYGINPPDRYYTWLHTWPRQLSPGGEWTMGPYSYGYVGEVPAWWMEIAANRTAPLAFQQWDPYPYMLNVSLGLPARWDYEPKHLVTFDGTDLLMCAGSYGTVDNHTDVLSYDLLINGSLNWRTIDLPAPFTEIDPIKDILEIPPDTWIFGGVFGLHDLKVLSPTRAVGLMNTIGFAGMNFTHPSPKGEWPLILLDNNGSHVEMAARAANLETPFGDSYYATGVENATYEGHTVTPIMPYDETRFLVTSTGVEASVLVCYSIAHDNFTIVWKKPVDRGNLNRGFLIDDLNNDGDEEIIAVLNENVTVLDGTDGSTLYTTDVSTFTVVDVAHLSLGDVILTNEGNGVLVTFGGSNHTTYWNQTLGVAWETYISPMQDVDEDGHTDLIVARESNVTCFWGYYEIYTPPPIPIQEELWFWIAIMVVLDAVVIGVVSYMRKRALARETAATA